MQPPIAVEEFNTNNLAPAITVEGDAMLKEYQFIVEESKEKLLKIGRAVHDLSELGHEEVRTNYREVKNISQYFRPAQSP